jgi:CRISPR/Cas system-associated protein Csm6
MSSLLLYLNDAIDCSSVSLPVVALHTNDKINLIDLKLIANFSYLSLQVSEKISKTLHEHSARKQQHRDGWKFFRVERLEQKSVRIVQGRRAKFYKFTEIHIKTVCKR